MLGFHRFSSSEHADYRFGFNGMEKDDEVAGNGNSYTANSWQYDARLGRRWNIDPVVKQHESPYAAFANNPVWFIDPSGRDTSFADNKTKDQFNSTMNEVNNMMKVLGKKIDRKMDKWEAKGYDNDKLNARMSKQIGRLNADRASLGEISDAFNEVIASKDMFHYTALPNGDGYVGGDKNLAGGGTSFNSSLNRWETTFFSGNTGTIVHETRHNQGASIGEFGWNPTINSPTNYDYQDEFEAYRLESNYQRIMNLGVGRTTLEITNKIKLSYGSKSYIIKDFEQHCECK